MLKLNKIHRRTLRVVYDDFNSSFEEFLASHNDISIHQKHIKHLAIEVYKSLNEPEPRIHVTSLQKQPYSLHFKEFKYLHFTSCSIVPLWYKFSAILR